MTGIGQDLKYAIRTLRRTPVFTLAAVITLALGIGANTAIFSVVHAVLLSPLPYPDPDRLVVLWAARGDNRQMMAAFTDVEDWRTQNHSFDEIGVVRGMSVNLTGGETPDRLGGEFVTARTFGVFGATAAQGRVFTDEETRPGTEAAVTVLSDRMWRTRLGSDPAVIGKVLTLNGRPVTVIGVMPRQFQSPFGATTDLWMPVTAIPSGKVNFERGVRNVWAVGRLKAGVTLADGQRDLSAISARLASEYPASNAEIGASVFSLKDQVAGELRPVLVALLAAVALVLLVACANVANLQFARAFGRRHELSLRAALGAGRGRLFRQLFTESVVLAIAGGAAGVLLATVGVEALVSAIPGGLPNGVPATVSWTVLLFSLGVTLSAALIFGLTPAWYGLRSGLAASLRARVSLPTTGRIDPRNVLVVVELGLCLVLLVGAGLLFRSLNQMAQVQPGFDPHNLLTFQFRLPAVKYREPAQQIAFFDAALEEVRRVPGVTSAALVLSAPMSGNTGNTSYVVAGTAPSPGQEPVAQRNTISAGYFSTMRIPLLEGREFDSRDRVGSLPVAIVNSELARREWPGRSALGQRIREGADTVEYTIVGVVEAARQVTLSEPLAPQLYRPLLQSPNLFSNIVARTVADPLTLAPSIRQAIWAVDRDQPVWGIASMERLLDRSLGRLRFTMQLTGGFALLALVLAAIGVYGVIAYLVSQRTRDIGIRLAIGATPAQAMAPILRLGLRLTLLATGVGLIGALAGSRLLRDLLFGVKTTDPMTYAVVAVALATVALLASWIPARRAARIDPIVVLRND